MEMRVKSKQEVVTTLSNCFRSQVASYIKLDKLTRNLSGKIALSKGDFSTVIPIMEEKQVLLTDIDEQKAAVEPDILWWQENKVDSDVALSASLNQILDELEMAIKRFLQSEKLLQKQLDFYRKGSQ